MKLAEVTEVLGGQQVLRQNIHHRMDLLELSDRGVTKDALVHLARFLSCSMSQMAELLPVTERTIQRYAPEAHFNRVVSEHILQIAEVAAKGVDVFTDKERFLKWLRHPSPALANQTPMSLLRSRFGADMVLDELGRIEHGVFS